jgi:hypothetical protein
MAAASAWVRSRSSWLTRGLLVFVLFATLVQVVVSVHYGLQGADYQHGVSVETATVTRNIDHEPDKRVTVLYLFHSPAWLRAETDFLRAHHLSLFG